MPSKQFFMPPWDQQVSAGYQVLTQQRNLNGPDGQQAASQESAPVQQGSQQSPPAQQQNQSDAFYQLARKDGEAAYRKMLQEKLGSDNLEDLAKRLTPNKPQVPDELVREIQTLKQENEKIKKETEKQIQREKFLSGLASLPQKPYEPTDVLDKVLSAYEIREVSGKEVVYKRGEDVPVFVGSEMASVKTILEQFQKERSWMFQGSQPTPHMQQTGVVGDSWNPKKSDFDNNPNLLSAIRASGQYAKFIRGEAISRSLVDSAAKLSK